MIFRLFDPGLRRASVRPSGICATASKAASSSLAADRESCELIKAGVSGNGTSDLLVTI
jgi:hypothetical protein